ncbi:MAG TPA: hypothetical protein VGN69_04340 [Solirubrobacteraceae bacterium]|jgi:hypothetical protein|nr:hypothetical protein [Solirubrobacteraceae bacterium]
MDPDVPPAGEEIHLPGPSLLPLLTAVGITLMLLGLTLTGALIVAGGVLTLICLVRWVREVRAEVDELPLDTPRPPAA